MDLGRSALRLGLLAGFALAGSLVSAAEPAAGVEAPFWRWRHPAKNGCAEGCGEDCGQGCLERIRLPGGGTAELRVLDARSGALTVQARVGEKGPVTWEHRLEPAAGDAGALLALGDRVVVASHRRIASGCQLRALDAKTGRELWRTALRALGPVSHSQYLNHVQLDTVDGRVAVFGDEIGGRYVEVVDPASGESLVNARVDARLAAIPWAWDAPRPEVAYPSPISIPAAGGGRYELTQSEKPERAAVSRLGADGKPVWRVPLEFQFVGAAALLELGETLYVAHHCAIASGVTVYAFDAASGALRFKVHPLGVGPIAHSKYSNQVALRAVDGRPVVFGHESAGNYVEVLDPQTGRSLWNEVWPVW